MTALSADAIVAAGAAIVAAEGWSGLSVRSVAGHLGVTPMALYRHISDSDALATATIARIASGMLPVTATGDAIDDLRRWCSGARAALGPFHGAAEHLLTVWFEVPEVLEVIEGLLTIVHDDGRDGFEAVAAANAVFMYVLMRCAAEGTVREARAVRRTINLAAARTDLPHLRELAIYYTTARFDDHFDYGLDVLLAGIHSRAGTHTRAAPRRTAPGPAARRRAAPKPERPDLAHP